MAAFRKFIGNFHVFNTFISSGIAGTKCFLRVTTRSLNNRAFLGTTLKMELKVKLQSRFLACCESRLSRWSGASLTCPSYSSTSSIITRRVKARRLSTEHHKFQLWPPQMSKSHSALTRQKHSKTSNKKRGNKEESDSESSDEEFEDDQVIGGEENLKGAPAEFSVRQVYLKTLRADAVVSVGLNISRNKVDDLSYSSKLRVNGERLQKKSHMMEMWDTVDLVTEVSEGGTTVQRVQVIKVDAKKTGKDKLSVWIRVWKKGFVVA